MKTIVIDYPTKLSFRTKKEFANDNERTEYLQKLLRRKHVYSPNHDYNDYVVELTKDGVHKVEVW